MIRQISLVFVQSSVDLPFLYLHAVSEWVKPMMTDDDGVCVCVCVCVCVFSAFSLLYTVTQQMDREMDTVVVIGRGVCDSVLICVCCGDENKVFIQCVTSCVCGCLCNNVVYLIFLQKTLIFQIA